MVRGGRVYEAVLRRRHGGDVRAALASSSSSHLDLIEHYRPLSDALIVDSLHASRYSILLALLVPCTGFRVVRTGAHVRPAGTDGIRESSKGKIIDAGSCKGRYIRGASRRYHNVTHIYAHVARRSSPVCMAFTAYTRAA